MSEIFHQHIPVLLNEAVAGLITNKDGIYIDATFGRGSHSRAILDSLNDKGRLLAFDKDPEAVAYAEENFLHDKRFSIIHSSFARLDVVLEELDLLGKINGILFDLGVSSPQLDNPERGFSFAREGKLDMRMDTTHGISAMEWVASVKEEELADVLWQYGEEKFSRRIARAIVTAREVQPITSTIELADIIKKALPGKFTDKHPATRSFQAIRIFINQELSDLQNALAQALDALAPSGRLAVISFHSLEDRIVKQFIRHHEKGPEVPRGLPIKNEVFQGALYSVGKPVKPSESEINLNVRARSAILRIAEKKS